MYYSIEADPFNERGIIGDPKFPNDISFMRGAFINWQPDAPLLFRSNCDDDNLPREYMGRASLPVWSKALLNEFRLAGVDNIQAFPAVVEDIDGNIKWKDYFAINVIGKVSAADLSESEYIEIGERPGGLPFAGFQNIVIDPEKARGFLLFRLAENPLELIAHQRIIDHLISTAPSKGWGILLSVRDKNSDNFGKNQRI